MNTDETRAHLAALKAAAGPAPPPDRRPPCGEAEANRVEILPAPPSGLPACIALLELAERHFELGDPAGHVCLHAAVRGLKLLPGAVPKRRADGRRKRKG